MTWRWLVIAAAAAGLAGCAGVQEPSTGQTDADRLRTINDTYRVAPQTTWQRSTEGPMERWTVAGPRLHQLRLYGGLESGETLFPKADASALPEWDGRPRAHSVAEFLRASLAQWGATRVQTTNLEPAAFGDRAGFRLRLSLAAPSGLQYQGIATGTTTHSSDGERLHLIIYVGTASHHYGAYEDEVRALIRSVDFL